MTDGLWPGAPGAFRIRNRLVEHHVLASESPARHVDSEPAVAES